MHIVEFIDAALYGEVVGYNGYFNFNDPRRTRRSKPLKIGTLVTTHHGIVLTLNTNVLHVGIIIASRKPNVHTVLFNW